jgi:ParB-like chromosome segregation protein Spo0J
MQHQLAYERVNIASLKFDPRNARKHDDRNIKAIMDSLSKFGQQKAIVVGEDNIVIAGNGTLEAAKRLGWDTIDVRRSGLKSDEATAYAIADNRSAELAEWDDPVLGDILSELKESGWELDDLGFNDEDIKSILSLAEEIELPDLKSGDKEPFQQMAFVLSDNQAETVKRAIDFVKKNEYLDNCENKNMNGNAIFLICQKYIGE